MKPLEIRELETEELADKLAEMKEELFNLRFRLATGQLDNHRRMRKVRRDMARIRTVVRQREIEDWERLEASASAPVATEDEAGDK